MQDLYCRACRSPVPLNAPQLSRGRWHAVCGACEAANDLEVINANVFLPLRFRVLGARADGRFAGTPPQPGPAAP